MKSNGKIGSNKKQRGFTAIELIVVLVVGLSILAMAAGKTDMLFGNSNLSEEVSNVNTLYANVKTLKTSSGYGAAGTDLTAQLVATNGVPRNMTVTGGVIYNLWGGTVLVASTGAGFTITQNTVPMDGCIKASTKISKGGTFSSIKINTAAAVTGEVTSAAATASCTSAASNTIVFASNS